MPSSIYTLPFPDGVSVGRALQIAAGAANPHIDHNWDFKNPVNQRSQSNYSAGASSVYSIDRWTLWHCALAINAGTGITLTGSAASGQLGQKIENYAEFAGKTITLSANILGGTGINNGANLTIYDGVNYSGVNITAAGIVSVTATLSNYPSTLQAILVTQSGAGSYTLQIAAVKLELGSVSTLANDAPAVFGEELRKCQRYYWKSFPQNVAPANGAGRAGSIQYVAPNSGVGYCSVEVQFPVNMRTAPTVTFYSPSSANAKWFNYSAGTDSGVAGTPFSETKEHGLTVFDTQAAGDNAGNTVAIHVTASADL